MAHSGSGSRWPLAHRIPPRKGRSLKYQITYVGVPAIGEPSTFATEAENTTCALINFATCGRAGPGEVQVIEVADETGRSLVREAGFGQPWHGFMHGDSEAGDDYDQLAACHAVRLSAGEVMALFDIAYTVNDIGNSDPQSAADALAHLQTSPHFGTALRKLYSVTHLT
jgi:hypothetical protein